jgi:carboxypeptidase family protein/all-beta uncharacterized protein
MDRASSSCSDVREVSMRRNVAYTPAALLLVAIAACNGAGPTGGRTLSFGSLSTGPTSPSATTVSLLGRVTDAATGNGIGGASLSIADGGNDGKAATTDLGGNYILMGLETSEFLLNVVAPTYAAQSRHITLTANQILSIELTKCSFTLSIGTTIDSSPDGGSFPVTVTTAHGCEWTAAADAPWIHLPPLGMRTGTDTFTFTIDANTGPTRSGTLTIAGRKAMVVQSGRAAS